jgi:hypothetical protein
VVSDKSLAAGGYEIKKRREKVGKIYSEEEIIKSIRSL